MDFPRKRPIARKQETHFEFFEIPKPSAVITQPIITKKFNPRVAIIEPSKNVHHSTGLDPVDPHYLCQPEVRKARHEILIKKRPPSPNKTLCSAIKHSGTVFPGNDEEEENRLYNARSKILPPSPVPPIQVTIEDVDEPHRKTSTLISIGGAPPKYGRRASNDNKINVHRQRNQTKIIEGNRDYLSKKNSLTSTTTANTDDDSTNNGGGKLISSKSLENEPSFVILKEPYKKNKWMKSSWYY